MQTVRDILSGDDRTLPYASRVFGLPKTHSIAHSRAAGDDELRFHLWALSFFLGMRLSDAPAGYLDCTPVEAGRLVDFALVSPVDRAVNFAESFWTANKFDPKRAKYFSAIVHALFLGQTKTFLQFEAFVWLYTALDACFALTESIYGPALKAGGPRGRRVTHEERFEWMSGKLGLPVPSWAAASVPPGGFHIARLRNPALHEGLFVDQPLGFAVHGVGTGLNINLEMQALICRVVVALLGGSTTQYVSTPVNTRSIHALELS